jgi:hypothetical protein
MAQMTGNAPFTIENVEVIMDTDKALLCRIDGMGGPEVWLPRKLLLSGTTVEFRGDFGEVVIPTWLAEERQLWR